MTNPTKPTPLTGKEIAIVTWIDAALHGDDTIFQDDLHKCHLVDGVAVGIIVKEDKESITLAMDWFYNEYSYRQLHTYPKSGITKLVKRKIKSL